MAQHDVEEWLSALVSTISAQTDFESACEVLLDGVMAATRAACAGAGMDDARTLRGIFHLGRGHYTGMVARPSHGEMSLYSSRTAWWALQTHKAPLMLDLMAQQLVARGALVTHETRQLSDESESFFSSQGTSHIIAIPANPELEAMVSIELELSPFLEREAWLGLWSQLSGRLQLAVELTAPLVMTRSHRRRQDAQLADDLLPVVGERVAPLLDTLRRFARYDDTILLTGETGVGKSRLARWLHVRSPREDKPFEVTHIQNMPPSLVSGELFGWRRGAHSQAHSDRTGCVARAEGGTLFLDEIDRLPLEAQDQLLWLLESRRYRVLGDSGPERRADVRFIVSSNVDLEAAVEAGHFRKDLYYRIAALKVEIPPLRQRTDEIPQWAGVMLQRLHHQRRGRGQSRLTAAAATALCRHAWPGNLRELEQALRRGWVLAEQDAVEDVTLDVPHIEAALSAERAGPPSLVDALRLAARAFVHAVMEQKLPLNTSTVFRSFVVEAAVEATGGDVAAAYTALGELRQVRSRNHTKSHRAALRAIAAFEQTLRDLPSREP